MVKTCCLIVAAFCTLAVRADAAPVVSMVDAKKIALARVPGTVMHEKLKHAKKKKKGHDYYSIKIAPRGHAAMWKKIEIDKETGQILKIKDVKPKDYDE